MLRFALSFPLVACVACSAAPVAVPDASTVPRTAAGSFAVTSELELAAPIPGAAASVLAELSQATDGADDPARYLVDRLVAALPPGTLQTAAEDIAPIAAAYLETKINDFAPNFAPGIAALVRGLGAASTRLGTSETLRIEPDGTASRAITGIRFDAGRGSVEVELATAGVPDLVAPLDITLDGTGRLAFSDHVLSLPYGQLLRVALDRVVVPAVVPGATDLGQAFQALVDCDRLGSLVADELDIDVSTALATACKVGLTAAAADLESHLAALDHAPLELRMTGVATGYDRDGDGSLDEIDDGAWTGAVSYDGATGPLGGGTFGGSRE
jgi:hypothetical protein